ncbi:toxin-antitoxin system toxin component [Cyanobacterium sp. HL-69]|uniref:HepT-like ribonuclease domain-containing protein n=1 Tax=Cyanobacterium sp. HL-69 TaxID=2054282 RepID=UPI000CA15176|nr:toxin-antitoxin system toxin component [Cyanobacterium sp. HL-69]
MRDDTERIKDIQEYIEKIEKYVVRGEREFYEDELIQTLIIHNLQIIGEASRATFEQFKAKYCQLDWQDMADFRNLIVYEYFRVDLGVV